MPYDQPYQQQPPGIFGASAQASGFGLQSGGMGFQQDMARQQGGMMAGAAAANTATNTIPGLAVAGYMGVTMVAAPLMEYGASAGVFGKRAGNFGRRLGYLDPFNAAMTLGMKGGGLGMRAAGGFAGRSLGGMALGAMGGAAGAAVPAGVVLGAAALGYMGVKATLGQMYKGAQAQQQGQVLTQQLGASAGFSGNATAGQGQQMAGMMKGMGRDLGMDPKELGRVAKELNSERVFQTVSGMKEFQSKFKEVMGAVKEISQMTQSTIDEAAKTFTDLKRQGFYTTADIKAAAVRRDARESSTGLSSGQMSAVGAAGAQMGRAFGMRGRVGSEASQSSVSALAGGLRRGTVSEELVGEMGGVEQAAMRMTRKQMGFLSSPRGRAMIAMSMKGDGTGMDPQRMAAMMQEGVTTESIVTGAAGRGLGILGKAGTREAREKALPYASMMMVQMAASQSRQLGWGDSRKSTLGMLGTMGVSQDEGELMMQQMQSMPAQMRAEAREKKQGAQAAYYEKEKSRSVGARLKRDFARTVTDPMEATGSDFSRAASDTYTSGMEMMTGRREYTFGGKGQRQDLEKYLARGGGGVKGDLTKEGDDFLTTGLFGARSGRTALREEYGQYMESEDEITARGGTPVKVGQGGLGGTGYFGGGKEGFIDVKRVQAAQAASKAAPLKLSKAQRENIALKVDDAGSGWLSGRSSEKQLTEGRVSALMKKYKGAIDEQGMGAKDVRTYEILRGTGALEQMREGDQGPVQEGEMDFETYLKLSPEERTRMTEGAKGGLRKEGVSETDIEDMFGGGGDQVSGLSLTREQQREELSKRGKDFFSKAEQTQTAKGHFGKGNYGKAAIMGGLEFAGIGALGRGLEAGLNAVGMGKGDMFGEAMRTSASARHATGEIMAALKMRPGAARDTALRAARKKLRESDAGAIVSKEVDEMIDAAERDPEKLKEIVDAWNDNGMDEIIGSTAYMEIIQEPAAQRAQAMDDWIKTGDRAFLDKAEGKAMRTYQETLQAVGEGKGEYKDLVGVTKDVFRTMAGGDKKLDDEELSKMAGTGLGGLGSALQQLSEGKGDKFDSMIKSLEEKGVEFGDADMKKLKEGGMEGAMEVMTEKNLMDPTQWGEGGKGEGEQKSIGEAMVMFSDSAESFADAVTKFIDSNPQYGSDPSPDEDGEKAWYNPKAWLR